MALWVSFSLVAFSAAADLPNTRPLEMRGDLSLQVLEAVDRFLLHEIDESSAERRRRWSWDYSSQSSYLSSIEENRDRFRHRIGAVDDRLPIEDLKLVFDPHQWTVGRREQALPCA